MPKAAKGLTRSDRPGQNSKPPLTIKPNLASSQMWRRKREPSAYLPLLANVTCDVAAYAPIILSQLT